MSKGMQINVVLLRTLYAGNIGSVGRVMANMGVKRLILVEPRTVVNSQARKTAAGAQSSLDGVIVYKNWDEFYENEGDGIRIGFCCREGRDRNLKDFAQHLKTVNKLVDDDNLEDIYLIFGPEDNGFDTDEMAKMNFRARLPTFGSFQSMNLSHAVLLALYMLQESLGANRRKRQKTFRLRQKKKAMFFPEESVRQWIEAMGFDVEARQGSAFRTMQRVLLQNAPSDFDLTVFEAVLQQCIRKLKGQESPLELLPGVRTRTPKVDKTIS